MAASNGSINGYSAYHLRGKLVGKLAFLLEAGREYLRLLPLSDLDLRPKPPVCQSA